MSEHWSIWIDGASRNNPGEASAGGIVKNSKHEIVAEWGVPLGIRTNNEAEYFGLLIALHWLLQHPFPATIHTDSQLMAEQVAGRYKVKAANLQWMFQEVRTIINELPSIKVLAVRREMNRDADRLANKALDEKRRFAPEEIQRVIDDLTTFGGASQGTLF